MSIRQLRNKTTTAYLDIDYDAGWDTGPHAINPYITDVVFDIDVGELRLSEIVLAPIMDEDGNEGWFIPASLVDSEVRMDVSCGQYEEAD